MSEALAFFTDIYERVNDGFRKAARRSLRRELLQQRRLVRGFLGDIEELQLHVQMGLVLEVLVWLFDFVHDPTEEIPHRCPSCLWRHSVQREINLLVREILSSGPVPLDEYASTLSREIEAEGELFDIIAEEESDADALDIDPPDENDDSSPDIGLGAELDRKVATSQDFGTQVHRGQEIYRYFLTAPVWCQTL